MKARGAARIREHAVNGMLTVPDIRQAKSIIDEIMAKNRSFLPPGIDMPSAENSDAAAEYISNREQMPA